MGKKISTLSIVADFISFPVSVALSEQPRPLELPLLEEYEEYEKIYSYYRGEIHLWQWWFTCGYYSASDYSDSKVLSGAFADCLVASSNLPLLS